MPRLKEVDSLYFQCLNHVFDYLFEILTSDVTPEDFELLRYYLVSHLNGSIREHILKMAVLKDKNRFEFLLRLIDLLMDSNVTYLYPRSGVGFLLPCHYHVLLNDMKKRNCIGLKTFCIRILYDKWNEKWLDEEKDDDPVLQSNKILYSLLKSGLARSLTNLTLHKCCDNDILQIIGERCVHLTKLDIQSSCHVTDDGIRRLCLKSYDYVEDLVKKTSYTPRLITKLLTLETDCLNTCCFSLVDVRIQDTKTSNSSIIMLLFFVKNLKAIDGYPKNVGDNVIYLSRLLGDSFKLNLTELFDPHIQCSKQERLPRILPNLAALYTKNIFVVPSLAKFEKLTDLTVIFDERPCDETFFEYFSENGHQLKRVHIVSHYVSLDIVSLLQLCPNLVEISGLLTINNPPIYLPVPNLKKVNLTLSNGELITWLFHNAFNLEHLEIDESEWLRQMPGRYPGDLISNFDPRTLDARRLRNIIRSSPACFNTLKFFIVRTIFSLKPKISKKTVISFISSCKQLKVMGDLFSFWLEITQVRKIKHKLRRRNLDVSIIYKKRHERITMDTLTDMNMYS